MSQGRERGERQLTCPEQHRLGANLREAVTAEYAAFLSAFDAAVRQPTPENLGALRAASDRLLRATARVRIELERADDQSG